jgi:predicted permease
MSKKRDKVGLNRSEDNRFKPKDIFRRTNRGILLDVVVFLANLFLMRMLMERFVGIAEAAYANDGIAQFVIFLYFSSLLFLAPVGAVLKRWHFHERLAQSGGDKAFEPSGCLFNPILYYSLMVVIYAVIDAVIFPYFYSEQEHPGLFVGTAAIGMIAMGIHTWLVYRYFTPPKQPPRWSFLLSPVWEMIGDICIFVNMLFFQILWNLLSSWFIRPKSGYDVFANLLAMTFAALLIYFPPRMIYLAEDIRRRKTWVFIALANLPVIYHALFGSGHGIELIR